MPEKCQLSGMREMKKEDVARVHGLVSTYLKTLARRFSTRPEPSGLVAGKGKNSQLNWFQKFAPAGSSQDSSPVASFQLITFLCFPAVRFLSLLVVFSRSGWDPIRLLKLNLWRTSLDSPATDRGTGLSGSSLCIPSSRRRRREMVTRQLAGLDRGPSSSWGSDPRFTLTGWFFRKQLAATGSLNTWARGGLGRLGAAFRRLQNGG